jgi:putative endonuclease
MARRQSIGKWGEGVAAQYLEAQGYKVLQKNVRTPYGEIDLIAQNGQTIVFVEVKTRTSNTFGLPEISVNNRKIRHLVDGAQSYIQLFQGTDMEWRVDVIAIVGRPGDLNPMIEVFENAVS